MMLRTTLVLAAAACGSPTEASPLRELSGTTMGTTYMVKIVGSGERSALDAAVHRILQSVDARMSTFRSDSELSRFNASKATDWFSVSAATRDVVAEALRISRLSHGAFDVTVGPLVRLWGFGPRPRRGRVPSAAEIAAAKERIGYRRVQVRASPPAIRKSQPEIELDLSALAKGFAVDAVARELERRGFRHFLVEVGGELRAAGRNAQARPWQVAIERPTAGAPVPRRIVPLQDRAIATSGDYRNSWEHEGVRYSHVLDPRTGWPIAHGAASVTVLADSAMRADALATALLVLGPQEGMALAEAEGLAVSMMVRGRGGLQELGTIRR